MAITVEELLTRLNAEAARRRISPRELLEEILTLLPCGGVDEILVNRRIPFAGIGASLSGRNARDADEMLGEGFGRSSTR